MSDLMQAMESLALANEVRVERSKDKFRIKAGELDPAALLRGDVAAHWENAKVVDLLLAMHRVGRTKSLKWLAMEQINPARKIGSLTIRQRARLAAHIDAHMLRRDDLRRQMDAAR